MLSRYTYGPLEWIDLESPTPKEVKDIVEKYGIAPLVAEELLIPSMKPRAEFHEQYAYIILHFPGVQRGHALTEQEVDFIIGEKFLITTHYDSIDPLHAFSKIFEVHTLLEKSTIGDHGFYLFFYMLRRLYREIEHDVDHIRKKLLGIEERLFSAHEVDMVRAISEVSSDLLRLRQTIEPHREVLKSIDAEGAKFFGEKSAVYLHSLANEYYRLHNHIMRHTDTLSELRETNNSLLSTKENETMRMLTIMALLTFPLSLMVAILQIDTVHNPIRGLPGDFWIILGTVVFTGACMIFYFKRKGWL